MVFTLPSSKHTDKFIIPRWGGKLGDLGSYDCGPWRSGNSASCRRVSTTRQLLGVHRIRRRRAAAIPATNESPVTASNAQILLQGRELSSPYRAVVCCYHGLGTNHPFV